MPSLIQKLDDEDLGQVDELYKVLNPTRADNLRYGQLLDSTCTCITVNPHISAQVSGGLDYLDSISMY